MSIAKKLTLVVTLLAALLALLGGYGSYLSSQWERDARIRTRTRLVAQLARMIVESAPSNYGQLGAMEDKVSRAMPARLTVYGPDGIAVAPVPTEEDPEASTSALRVMDRGMAEEEPVAGGFAYRVPIVDRLSGRTLGALEMRVDLDLARGGTWPGMGMAVSLTLLLTFALVVGVFSRQAIQRPVSQLMEGMDHVIKGDLTHALPLDRDDEIGRIAYRFNEMTAQLRDAQEQIRSAARSKLRLEQRLRQSEKLATMGQLSAEIAHEVGTPLNVIGGRARAVERRAEDPERVRKNARIIADQADRIAKIIQQVLDLSRARPPRREAVDPRAILDDALTLLDDELTQLGIDVVRDEDPTASMVGDPDGLQQVLINLMHNAVQAMVDGGTLSVSVRQETRRKGGLEVAPPGHYACLEVRDTGPGIPEERLGQIFEPFFSTKDRGEGTGLGLTVVQGIVKEHDGWVEVVSEEGKGTAFRVYLPVDASLEPKQKSEST